VQLLRVQYSDRRRLSSFSVAVGWMIAADCGLVTFYYVRRSRILGSVGGGCRRTEQPGFGFQRFIQKNYYYYDYVRPHTSAANLSESPSVHSVFHAQRNFSCPDNTALLLLGHYCA
jgi:hypothetical protein